MTAYQTLRMEPLPPELACSNLVKTTQLSPHTQADPTDKVLPGSPDSDLVITSEQQALQQFGETVKATAFSVQLSKRQCAALLAMQIIETGLAANANNETQWHTAKAFALAHAKTRFALIERGLIAQSLIAQSEHRCNIGYNLHLTEAGKLVASLVTLAGFTFADFDPVLNERLQLHSTSQSHYHNSNDAFREYVTSTAFALSLSDRMCTVLTNLHNLQSHSDPDSRWDSRWKLNQYSHFISTVKSLLSRGLVWYDDSVDRSRQNPYKLTTAGHLVVQLLQLIQNGNSRNG